MMGGTDWIPDPYCDPEIAAEKPRGDQTPSPDASLKPLSATGPAVRNRGHGPATLRDVPVKPGRTALCPRLSAGTWDFGNFGIFGNFGNFEIFPRRSRSRSQSAGSRPHRAAPAGRGAVPAPCPAAALCRLLSVVRPGGAGSRRPL